MKRFIITLLISGGILGLIATIFATRLAQAKCFGTICLDPKSIHWDKSDIQGTFTDTPLIQLTGTKQFNDQHTPVMMEVDCPNHQFRITKVLQSNQWISYPAKWTIINSQKHSDLSQLIHYVCLRANDNDTNDLNTSKRQNQSQTASLLDEIYQYCNYPIGLETQSSLVCFSFRKESGQVVGLLYSPFHEDYSICIQGKLDNKKVTGVALEKEFFIKTKPILNPKFSGKDLNYLDSNQYIKVAQGNIHTSFSKRSGYSKEVYYSHAILNFQNFYLYESNKIKLPENCSR